MQCSSCSAPIGPSVKFCPNCGAKNASAGDILPANAITVEWVRQCFESDGYKVEGNKDTGSATCIAGERYNVFFQVTDAFRPRVVSLQIAVRVNRKPSLLERKTWLEEINKLNASRIFVAYESYKDERFSARTHVSINDGLSPAHLLEHVKVLEEMLQASALPQGIRKHLAG